MKNKNDKEQKEIEKILARLNKSMKRDSFANENPNYRNKDR